MTAATDTYMLLRAFVDELARCGIRAACTSPGSRCAPLVLTLAHERRLRCYSHIDERCAGFFALGLAKSSGLPVAVACTSGTAAAELLPAAIEAHEARVPLLLLTADRPPELRETGAGQAIDQLKLFGDSAKWFFEVGTHAASDERLRWIRTLACRAYATALAGPPGVVHLNFPLREPLVTDEPLPDDDTARAAGEPYVRHRPTSPAIELDETLARLVRESRRGVIVAGRDERLAPAGHPSLAEAVSAFAEAAAWPLLADPLSGARRGTAAVAHYDALLRDDGFTGGLEPDLIVRVGDLPVSKPLRTWLAGLRDVRQVALDPERAWQDPAAAVWESFASDPAGTLSALARELASDPPARAEADAREQPSWLGHWRAADERAASAIRGVLGGTGISEPAVAAELGVLLPESATLFVASSMPVREIETFWPIRSDPPRVLCNRGANGIDGIVSSAFGAAAAGPGPTVLLLGDVALAHDLGGLLAARRLDLKLTIVLLDNGGGGIFDFLPLARSALARAAPPSAPVSGAAAVPRAAPAEDDVYTRHIATPTGLDFETAASLYGLAYERAEDLAGLRGALERALAGERAGLVHVRTERAANVRLHEAVWRAVSGAPRGDQPERGAR